jgi:hypothetical protein
MPNLRPLVRHAGVGLCFALAGCATMKNTPQQDYVWSCVEGCKAEIPPQCQVVNVATDGRISATCHATLANWGNFDRCMQQQRKERPYREWLKERGK